MSDDLVAFLLARLAEVAAEQRDKRKRWHRGGCSAFDYDASYDSCDCGLDVRVLAEVAAKRRIIDEHRPVTFTNAELGIHNATVCFVCHGRMDSPCDEEGEDVEGWGYPDVQLPWPCPTIRALASAFADHPDYREEWAL